MTLLDQQDREVVLPDQITEPVRRVAERSWALRVSMGLLQAMTLGLAVTLGGILALGMLPGMPITLRTILAVGAWGIGLWGLVRWALPAFKRLPFFSAARAIDEANPETHERISSAIELAAEEDERFKGSPELVNHLMRQAEQDAAAIDPAQVISGKSVLRWLVLALIILSMYMLAMLSVPRTFKEGLRGMTMPWVPGQTRPPIQLKVEPGENVTVAQGESLDITVSVSDPSRPDLTVDRAIITLSYTNGPAQAVEMERADATMFRTRLSAIQQNLSFSVSAAGEDSPVYKVNVVPRPGVASMSAVYTYPAYTRLAPKEDPSPNNGTLEALAGTHARVTLHTTQPVEPDQCFLVVGQGQTTIPLKPADATTLTGEVIINTSTTYVVSLVSKVDGRELKSDSARTRQIVARPDEAPRVTILSPAATARVRPDDIAPVRFTADDDFGLVSAEIVVQVDNRTPESLPVDLSGATSVHAERTFDLPVRDVLQRAATRDPKRITYYVRVTDNAQPKANVGSSLKQVLEIDRNADRLSLREDMAAAQSTVEALRAAEQKLISAAQKLLDLQKVSEERQLSGGERQRLSEARQEMTDATQLIEKAMESAPQSYSQQKTQLRDINDTYVRPGTEAAARAELSDEGARRQRNINQAAVNAAKARDLIAELRQRVDKSVQDERLKKSLADAAQRQQQLARDMENGGRPGEMQNRQEALKKDVEQMIRENENLRNAAKEKAEPKVKSLVDKLDEIAQRQGKASDQINDAAESAQSNDKLKKIIAEQERLNRDIARLEKQAGNGPRAAQAPIPDENKTGSIVKNLQDGQIQGAQAQQRVAANDLDKVASRAGPSDDQQPGIDTDTLKQEIDTLSQEIQTAKDAGRTPNRPSDQANQKAYDIATRLQRATNQPSVTPEQRRAQDDTRKLAQEAAQAARAGRAEEAQQKLNQATQAASRLQRTTPKISPQTGQQARALADRQRKLAEETAKLGAAVREADARKEILQRSEAEQKQLADDIDAAEREARELAKDTQPTTPETAEQAKRAAEALKKAAVDQRKSAEASKDIDTQQAGKAVQRAQSEVQQAKEELRPGTSQQQNAQKQQQSQEAKAQEQQLAQNGKPGENQPGDQKNAQNPDMKNDQAAGQQAQANNENKPGDQQQAKQDQQAQGKQPEQGQQGQQPQGQQAQGNQPEQGQGQQQAQQGQQGQQAQAGNSGQQQGGQQQSGSQQGGSAQANSMGGSQQGGNQQGGQQGQSGARAAQQQQLAQAIQEAHDAQQQAATEGNPEAAQRAAQALARAQQISQQMNGQQQGGQQQAGQSGAQQQAQGDQNGAGAQAGENQANAAAGQADGQQSQQPGQSAQGGNPSGTGVGVGKNQGDVRPEVVKEIGIAPSDWARLPPLLQKDLLNAAQQKGPPEYQQMIKNYYTQIARMQTDGDKR